MKDIAIIGIGVTKFGELFHQSYDDLVRDAAFQAINDAKIDMLVLHGYLLHFLKLVYIKAAAEWIYANHFLYTIFR